MMKRIENDDFSFPLTQLGVTTLRGSPRENKVKNEDQYVHKKLPNGQIFLGVYDGHGGSGCSEYLKKNLHIIYERTDSDYVAKPTADKLKKAFSKTDENWLQQAGDDKSGSTAVVALIDPTTHQLTIANTGDSRALVIHNNEIFSTVDHKPEKDDEYERIINADGKIIDERVEGILAVSRSFGDKYLKKWVISDPDVIEHPLEEDDLLVLASDDLWDAQDNEDTAKFIQEKLASEKKLSVIAKELGSNAEGFSHDDTTIMIFKNNPSPTNNEEQKWEERPLNESGNKKKMEHQEIGFYHKQGSITEKNCNGFAWNHTYPSTKNGLSAKKFNSGQIFFGVYSGEDHQSQWAAFAKNNFLKKFEDITKENNTPKEINKALTNEFGKIILSWLEKNKEKIDVIVSVVYPSKNKAFFICTTNSQGMMINGKEVTYIVTKKKKNERVFAYEQDLTNINFILLSSKDFFFWENKPYSCENRNTIIKYINNGITEKKSLDTVAKSVVGIWPGVENQVNQPVLIYQKQQ